MTATFVLRRTADILAKYLPPRVEQEIFCRLSPLQVALYRAFLKSKAVTSLVERTTESGAPMATALSCITSLVRALRCDLISLGVLTVCSRLLAFVCAA